MKILEVKGLTKYFGGLGAVKNVDLTLEEGEMLAVVGPYVFQKIDGFRYRSIKTTWNRCCKDANVKNARIHDIRHKALTDLGKKGYSLQHIGKIAGHTQTSTTLKYTHLRAEDTREALESLSHS